MIQCVTRSCFSIIALDMKSSADPVQNLTKLIACPSVTPNEGGALSALEAMLLPLGFSVERPVFSEDGTPDVEISMRGGPATGRI